MHALDRVSTRHGQHRVRTLPRDGGARHHGGAGLGCRNVEQLSRHRARDVPGLGRLQGPAPRSDHHAAGDGPRDGDAQRRQGGPLDRRDRLARSRQEGRSRHLRYARRRMAPGAQAEAAMNSSTLGVIFAVSAALLAGTGTSRPALAETGVSDGEIRLGMWTSLSGPLSLLGQSQKDGVSVWAKEVNDRGGINGRKINLIAYDDAASPQEAQTAVRRLIDQDKVFMLIAGSSSGSTLPVRQFITREKVPFVSSYSSNVNLMN